MSTMFLSVFDRIIIISLCGFFLVDQYCIAPSMNFWIKNCAFSFSALKDSVYTVAFDCSKQHCLTEGSFIVFINNFKAVVVFFFFFLRLILVISHWCEHLLSLIWSKLLWIRVLMNAIIGCLLEGAIVFEVCDWQVATLPSGSMEYHDWRKSSLNVLKDHRMLLINWWLSL